MLERDRRAFPREGDVYLVYFFARDFVCDTGERAEIPELNQANRLHPIFGSRGDLFGAERIGENANRNSAEDESTLGVEPIAEMGEDRQSAGREDGTGQGRPGEEPDA